MTIIEMRGYIHQKPVCCSRDITLNPGYFEGKRTARILQNSEASSTGCPYSEDLMLCVNDDLSGTEQLSCVIMM